jgi:hypothetical protein
MDAVRAWKFATIVLLGACAAGLSLAQTPAQDTGTGPALELSAAQRDTIFQSVSKTQKNYPAPTGFRVAVGGRLPEAIALSPVPATIAELMPQTKDFQVTMIEKQVVLVDPKTKQIAAVITQETR